MKHESTHVRQQIDELAESFVGRFRNGERPTVEEYAVKYPEIADELRELLPALVLLEQQARLEIIEALDGNGPSPSASLPREIGDFSIVREIGRGGMGMVYEAIQQSLSRRVALKILPVAATLDQRALQRFRNETMAVAQLDHPNIVDVFGVGTERGIHFYAMRYIDGASLAEIIGRLGSLEDEARGNFPQSLGELATNGTAASGSRLGNSNQESHSAVEPVDAVADAYAAETVASQRTRNNTRHAQRRPVYFRSIAKLGIQVAEALDHAHQVGIIHRDIKPSNLMVDARGKAWVTDFGLARIEAGVGLTMTGDIIGTLRYMSPEQALAKHTPMDHRADIYSLGVTLYELLTLTPAFTADDRRELLRQIAFEEPAMPRRLDPSIPAELETVVCKAMAKEPGERYATAQELADDLRRFVHDQPILARRPSLAARIGRWSRHHKSLVAAGAVLVAMGAIGSSLSAVMLAEERNKTAAALVTSEDQKRQLQINAEQLQREQQRAEQNFQKARAAVDRLFTRAAEELKDQPHMDKVRKQLLEDALIFYEEFLRDNGDDIAVREEAAHTYLRVGSIRQLLGQYAQSLEPLESAAALLEKLVTQTPNDATNRQRLADTYGTMAYAMNQSGESDKHLVYSHKAVTVLEDLHAQFPEEARHAIKLADGREEYACTLSVAGKLKESINGFARARDLYEDIHAKFPALERDRFRMAHLHHWLGYALQKSGRMSDAEQEYRAALDLRTQLLNESSADAKRKHHLAHIKAYLASLLNVTGRTELALELVEEAIVLNEECLDEFPDHADYIRRTASDYATREGILVSLGRLAEAETARERSSKLYMRLAGDSIGTVTTQSNSAWSNYSLGTRFDAAGEHEKAVELFRTAIAGFEQLNREHPESPKFLDNLAWVLATCPAVQFRDPVRAVELARKALQRVPSSASYWELLGIAQYRLGEFSAAISALTKADELGGGEQVVGWLFLAMARWQSGDQQAARELLSRANAWIAKYRSTDSELTRFHAEAIELIDGEANTQSQ